MELAYEKIEFKKEWKGRSRPNTPVEAIIQSEEQCRKFLTGAGDMPPHTALSINFSEEQLILVGIGERPTDEYFVEITQIMYFTDRGKGLGPLTVVSFREGKKKYSLDVVSCPFHMVKTKKLAGETRFEANPKT